MRALFDIAGGLTVALGIFMTLGGCVVGSINSGGYIMFWFGIALIVVGMIVCSAAGKKTCPKCAESVKYKALKCKHCGHEFGAPEAAAKISEPFYK
jgi:hypothetical protein